MSLPIRLEPRGDWEFEALAIYNAEKARGVAHDPEWDALMAAEQERFKKQQMDEWIARGGHPLDPDDPDGAWMVPGSPLGRWERFRCWIEDLW